MLGAYGYSYFRCFHCFQCPSLLQAIHDRIQLSLRGTIIFNVPLLQSISYRFSNKTCNRKQETRRSWNDTNGDGDGGGGALFVCRNSCTSWRSSSCSRGAGCEINLGQMATMASRRPVPPHSLLEIKCASLSDRWSPSTLRKQGQIRNDDQYTLEMLLNGIWLFK